ncbi:hypothetical protein AB1L88_15745 [Tautonia sp. JC769]|uniref:hypothetical protein n=1 Tax=Tautonia sp. JC769 TaxID=3232135 RepID=UPI00345893D3
MTPSFGGIAIFGQDCSINVVELPRRQQKDTYFGVDGTERKDGGFTGRVAEASGVLHGVGIAGLAAAEELFRTYYDGVPRVLVDTLGRAWPGMKLEEFRPAGHAMLDSTGRAYRTYSARFATG